MGERSLILSVAAVVPLTRILISFKHRLLPAPGRLILRRLAVDNLDESLQRRFKEVFSA